jgi:hypothetical protein
MSIQIEFIAYNTTTGEIIRHGKCMDNDLAIQAGVGESVLQGTYQPGTIVNGVWQPLTTIEMAENDAAVRQRLKARHLALKAQRQG